MVIWYQNCYSDIIMVYKTVTKEIGGIWVDEVEGILAEKTDSMWIEETKDLNFEDTSLGMMAKIQRVCRRLTKQDIARTAVVSLKNINLFESNAPLSLTAKRKLLRAYDMLVEASTE